MSPRTPSQFSSIAIAWSGAEDKPFPRALLVPASREAELSDRPFWSHAVIRQAEFERLLGVLEEDGRNLEAGAYRGQERGYYAEIETDVNILHAHLGFTPETARVLEQMNEVLDEAHRGPIQRILDRLSTAIRP